MNRNGTILNQVSASTLAPPRASSREQHRKDTKASATSWKANPVTEKCLVGGFIVFVLYLGFRALITAPLRPFWFDEVCTWTIVQQPGISGIWNALMHAADGQPPGFYILEKIPRLFFSQDEVALRIPTVMAFCTVLLCVFTWIRTFSSTIIAWICCLFLLFSPLRQYYATEARPYVIVAACLAFALVCYQRADRTGFVILLGLTLAAAQCFHYYAIFLVFPFSVAEAAFFLKNREWRIGVWLAICSPIVCLSAFLPLLSRLRAAQGAYFWAQPNAGETLNLYSWLIGATNMSLPVSLAGRLFVLAVFLGALIFLAFRLIQEFPSKSTRFEETTLLLALLLTPWVMYLALKMVHGGLTVRYMVPFTVTIPLVLAQFLLLLDRRVLFAIAAALLLTAVVLEFSFWKYNLPMEKEAFTPVHLLNSLLQQSGHPDLPVMTSNPGEYVSFLHYASPSLAERLVQPIDTPAEIAYTRMDTADKDLEGLAPYLRLSLPAYRDFSAQHKTFLLYTPTGGTERMDWWIRRFRHEGTVMKLTAQWGNAEIHLVQLPESGPAQNAGN